MKRSIFIFISLFLMYSCCPKDKQLIKLDLIEAWIPYQEGDKSFYSNENNEVDSIEINSVNMTFNTKGHMCTREVEHIDVNIKGNLFSYLHINLEPSMLYFFLHVNNKSQSYFYYFEEENTMQGDDLSNFYPEIVIENTNYNDVFVLENDSVMVYYGKNIGIIGYKVGGEEYIID